MLSVIIADDEQEVINLCRMLIEYPVDIVAEAHNGSELLDKINTLQPNLVITDICMPGINGLELIETVKKTNPEIHFILMSGYTDFEYARQAIRLGVWDYLLKPLQKTEINNLFKKLDAYINDNLQLQESNDRMKDHLTKSMEALKENYLRNIITNPMKTEVPRIGETPIFRIEEHKIQFMVFMIENQFVTYDMSDASVYHHSELFFEQVRLYGEKESKEMIFFREKKLCYCLFLYPEDYTAEKNREFVKSIYSLMRFYNDQNRFVSFSCGVSKLEKGSAGCLTVLPQQAQTALSWRIEEYEDLIHIYSETKGNLLNKEALRIDEDLLRNTFQGMDETCMMEIIDKIWTENYDGRPGEGIRILNGLSETFQRICGQIKIQFDRKNFLDQIQSRARSPKELLQNIKQMLREVMQEYKQSMAAKESITVSRAKQYVEKNYGKEVTLSDVSKYVCLSPAYFSAIFKEETGTGFVKYLQHVRIEKAKILLKESHISIDMVAHTVGYKDVRFFKKIFKSETNITPKEYRKFYS